MPRVQRFDQPLERATLAAGVLALEQHEEPGSQLARADLAAEVEAQLEEAALGCPEPDVVVGAAEPRGQVELSHSLADHDGDLREERPITRSGGRR